MKKTVLMIGNFLSSSLGVRGVCEDLAEHLEEREWSIIRASSYRRRLPRIISMVYTAWSRRSEYSVAQVDVFSGPAFLWAETVCLTLRMAGRPYVLTLHGGKLPVFATRWPKRVRNLLVSAYAVTTPSRYLLEHMKSYLDNVRLIANPIETGRYQFRLRKKPGPRIIWLRAFHEIYNPVLAPQVLSLL
jgi:glycosyltransferase involved in cell wall biosynthesis